MSDLSGKIVFKVKLDKEIKKIVIHNDDINYNELLLMMQRIFSDKIKPNDEFTIKYTDDENDLITLSNDSDVLLALQTSKILKLTIFLNENEEKVEEIQPNEIVKELYNIRTSIDRFLEKFERSLKLEKIQHKVEEVTKSANDIKLVNNTSATAPNIIKNDLHKEFDPLNLSKSENKHDVSHLKLPAHLASKNSRAQTPDSIASVEMSPSQPKANFSTNGHDLHMPAVQPQIQPAAPANIMPPQVQPQVQHPTIQNHQQQPDQHQLQQQQQAYQQQMLQSQPQAPQAYGQYQNPQAQIKPAQVQPSTAYMPPAQPQQPMQQYTNVQQPQQMNMQPTQMDPQAQAYYQQQQLYQQAGMPQQTPQPGFQGSPSASNNPYSKAPNQSLARPPSTTIYQQGYR